MSGFITAEGLVVPIGTDYYDYVNDQKRLADSVRSVVPVASQAAGNTVASSMASDGRSVSDTNPLAIWESDTHSIWVKGSSGAWFSAGLNNIRADSNHTRVNGYANILSDLGANNIFPFFQIGSYVVTTDINGYATIILPVAFPNGLIGACLTNGDNNITNGSRLLISQGTAAPTLSQLHIRVWDTGANASYNSSAVRCDYVVAGW